MATLQSCNIWAAVHQILRGCRKGIIDKLSGCVHNIQGEYIECTGCVHLPQYCPSTLMAARNIAPGILGQPCNLAILRALGTSHRRCACRP